MKKIHITKSNLVRTQRTKDTVIEVHFIVYAIVRAFSVCYYVPIAVVFRSAAADGDGPTGLMMIS